MSFLSNVVRDEISFVSDGSAFQARGPAMKKALSVTGSRVPYVKRRSFRAHWTEAGCRHSAERVLTDIVGAVPRLMSNIKVPCDMSIKAFIPLSCHALYHKGTAQQVRQPASYIYTPK